MKVDYADVVEICVTISRCSDGRKLNRLSLFEILSCSYDLEFSVFSTMLIVLIVMVL